MKASHPVQLILSTWKRDSTRHSKNLCFSPTKAEPHWSNGAGRAPCTLHRTLQGRISACLTCARSREKKQWSISILLGFNSYTVVCKRAKQSQFCFQMKSYTNLMEPLSRDNQRQRVAELQLKDALDALLKPANTWEASPNSALVSAAGTCPHTKDKPKGTSRGPFQHRPPQQPQAQAAREQPSLQG